MEMNYEQLKDNAAHVFDSIVDTLGKTAYETYVDAAGGVSKFTGDRLPKWEHVDDDIKHNWRVVGYTIHAVTLNFLEPPERGD